MPRPLFASGYSPGQMPRERFHIGIRLVEGDAGLQAADCVHGVADFAVAESGFIPLAYGDIGVAVLKIPAVITEIRRNHANDSICNAVQREHFSQRAR